MNEMLRQYYLTRLGVARWLPRDSVDDGSSPLQTQAALPSDVSCAPVATVHSGVTDGDVDAAWESLRQQVQTCTRCPLSQSRTQAVFGVGNRQAGLMIVGEAPGYHEDRQGEPFVGRAGQLLTAMLASIGLSREQVFIANVLKCRPPNTRDPQAAEVAECTPYLNRQIELVQPRLLLALGRFAAHCLLDSAQSLSRLRDQAHHYGERQTPLIVSYHPAYLLRNPKDKGKSYQDLRQVAQLLQQSESQNG
jgi:uracil-DNA glycosylase family 4